MDGAKDVETLRINNITIQQLHAQEKYEEALNKLEENQRICKKHYGTQSSDVSAFSGQIKTLK